jgi:hypothetical protein
MYVRPSHFSVRPGPIAALPPHRHIHGADGEPPPKRPRIDLSVRPHSDSSTLLPLAYSLPPATVQMDVLLSEPTPSTTSLASPQGSVGLPFQPGTADSVVESLPLQPLLRHVRFCHLSWHPIPQAFSSPPGDNSQLVRGAYGTLILGIWSVQQTVCYSHFWFQLAR